MNKIRSGQLFAILFLIRSFSLLCTDIPFSARQLGGALLSAMLQGLVLIPLLRTRVPTPSAPAAGLFGLFFLAWGGHCFLQLWGVAAGVTFPVHNKLFGALLLTAVCLYGVMLGIRALARSATLLLPLFGVALAVLILGAWRKAEPENLYAAAAGSPFAAAWQDFCECGWLPCAAYLCRFTPFHPRRAVYGALLAQLGSAVLVSLLGMAVLGRVGSLAEYPFFTLGAFSQPFATQRADAVYVVLFTLIGTITIAMQLYLAGSCIAGLFPRFPYPFYAAAAGTLLAAWGMHSAGLLHSWLYGVWILLLCGVLPLVQLLKKGAQRAPSCS
ncbi:hypothetical protein [Ruminococcus sp.]|uniref:hypothetical protein n=1 Tax=Ruminococcus sp. TaxID=41978 RepID=UPI0025DB8F9E|nr:hypothetical protein [Ruminococcus sp.]MCI5816423.1 hypothetical protein [Ruminococcus sp.]MDD7555150.1 hypothetical protein [Ruminococcus sp.]MDY4963182.1 hypothetical protein [Ruminococcus callidus]